jgi:tRNA (Thr-GGU) A37 N-methylase
LAPDVVSNTIASRPNSHYPACWKIRCRIISVEDNIVGIDGIDAFDGSPVLDLNN